MNLQTAVDQYRNWATEIRAVLDSSDQDTADLELRLAQMHNKFRAALQSKAAELASFDVAAADELCEGKAPLR